jgi:hypothetical protein
MDTASGVVARSLRTAAGIDDDSAASQPSCLTADFNLKLNLWVKLASILDKGSGCLRHSTGN